jgi:hypothetical protein
MHMHIRLSDISVYAVVYGIIYDYVHIIKCVLYIRKILF